MKATKLLTTFILALAVLLAQTGSVYAQVPVTYTVTALECGTDGTTVLVTYDDGDLNTPEVTTEVSLETAVTLGLIAANTTCSTEALAAGIGVVIDPTMATPVESGPQHPVGAALAAFFEGFADYDAIMAAHEDGVGFGVIAQALWLTKKLDNPEITFDMILQAKVDGDYSAFGFEEGTAPQNWGQFKKMVLNGDKKANLGQVMSEKEKPDKGKPDKENKGNKGNGNGNNKP